MNPAKIRLSPKEQELVLNADWILTKNDVLVKVRMLLENLNSLQKEAVGKYAGLLPEEVVNTVSKISRGENYKGLPYLVLDYPRQFQPENIFAVRTMFWWGNFFSTTLQLSGRYKLGYGKQLELAYERIVSKEIFVAVNEEEWEHHFEKDNYLPVRDISFTEWKQVIKDKPFIKLAKKIPLSQWNEQHEMHDLLYADFIDLIDILKMRDT